MCNIVNLFQDTSQDSIQFHQYQHLAVWVCMAVYAYCVGGGVVCCFPLGTRGVNHQSINYSLAQPLLSSLRAQRGTL